MKPKQTKNYSLIFLAVLYLFFAQFAPFVHNHDHLHQAHYDSAVLHSYEFGHTEHDVHDKNNHHGCCQVSSVQSVALQSAKVDKAEFSQSKVALLAVEGGVSEPALTTFTISILEPASQEYFKAAGTRAPPSIS